jgi:CAAX protease family protein
MRLIDRRLLVARKGRWQWYWGLLGLATVLAVTVAVLSIPYAIDTIWPKFGELAGFEIDDDLFLSPGRWDTYSSFVVFSVPVILATFVTIKWVHLWSVGEVLGPGRRFVWTHFGRSAAALFTIYTVATAIDFVVEPAQYTLQVEHWATVGWIILAGVVILPQAFSEEFLFNSYLMRLWGAVVPLRFVVAITLSVLFSLAHAANEDVGQDPWPAHASLFGGQLLALAIYIRTGSLGATVGLHWMNNTFTAGIVGSLPGYKNDLALVIYRDPVLSAGGTNLYDPWSWVGMIAGFLLVWLLVTWRRSPFHIPDRTDDPPRPKEVGLDGGTSDDDATLYTREARVPPDDANSPTRAGSTFPESQ